MSAIITDPFKKQLLQNVLDEVSNLTNRYYIGIGKNDQWNVDETVPTPTDTPKSIRDARTSLQSVKAVAAASYVVPRRTWSQGAIYDAYDDTFATYPTNSYYVLTEDNQVYICLQQSKDANGNANVSTVKPTGTSTAQFTTADGYTWKFLYALSSADASAFLSANFMPVKKVGNVFDSSDSFLLQQRNVQLAAIKGGVISIVVTDGGSNYTQGTTSVRITGNGTAYDSNGDSAAATATVVNGSITKIDVTAVGRNYDNASIVITDTGSGSGAKARAILGPPNGIGADPRDDLKSTSIMFNSKPAGNENSTFLVADNSSHGGTGSDFRQVMLIRDPESSLGVVTATSKKALRFLKTSSTSSFSVDDLITNGKTPPARAFVDQVDSNRVYFHQNDSSGFTEFLVGDTITNGSVTATLIDAGPGAGDSSFSFEGYDLTTGDILYIENRAPVIRNDNQTEDIKVVMTL